MKDFIQRPQWHSRENGEIRLAMSQTDAAFAERFESYAVYVLFVSVVMSFLRSLVAISTVSKLLSYCVLA